MDLNQLMSVIGVKKHKFEVAKGTFVYIRLPSISKYSECNDPYKTIYYCVVDEEGKPLFQSPQQIEEEIDMVIQVKLQQEITRLFTEAMNIDEVEKK